MKTWVIFFLGIVLSIDATAQLEELFFTVPQSYVCADSATVVQGWENWRAYQTLDGTWDGELDTTICLDLSFEYNSNTYVGITYEQADLERPVFIKWIFPDSVLLESDILYMFSFQADLFQTELGSMDCEDEVCNGVFLGIQIPSEPGDTSGVPNKRWYEQEFTEEYSPCNGEFSFCVPTEEFVEGNFLTDLILKLDLDPVQTDDYFVISELNFEGLTDCTLPLEGGDIMDLYGEDAYYFSTEFSCYTSDNCEFQGAYLVLWEGEGIPSDTNRFYMELETLQPNTTEPQDITIYVGEYNSLHLQPFTYFMGELVVGSDSIRNNIVYDIRGDLCLNQFVDVIIPSQGMIIFQKGSAISLQDGRSCLQLNGGGTMLVGEDANLDYGKTGQGMFALYAESAITLQEGSTLTLNNTMILAHHNWSPPGAPVEIFMNPGSTLLFGPNFKVQDISQNQDAHVVVHCNQGIIDFSYLSEIERSYFTVIYPEPSGSIDVINVFGNPVSESLRLSVHSSSESESTFQLFDEQGRIVIAFKRQLYAGYNYIEHNLSTVVNGPYTLFIRNEEGSVTQKIVVDR